MMETRIATRLLGISTAQEEGEARRLDMKWVAQDHQVDCQGCMLNQLVLCACTILLPTSQCGLVFRVRPILRSSIALERAA